MLNWLFRVGLSALGVLGFVVGCMPVPQADMATKDGFVGSTKCMTCHAEEYKSWQDSWHAKIVRPKKEAILEEAVEKWASDGTNPGPTVGNVTGQPFSLDEVQYVVGSRWKQRFLVKNEQTGNLQFMDKQMNRASGKWEKYDQQNDWNTMCATCHTTGYRITEYDETAGKTVKSDFVEMGVGCEACHGPGAKHVKSMKKKNIFNPGNLDFQAQSMVCGYCHIRLENKKWKSAQGNPRADFPAPKLGATYKAGGDWTKWYPSEVIIPGLQANNPFDKEYSGELEGLFKVDDFAKANGVYEEAKHHQEYQGFIQSTHFKLGAISCITCHSPHAGKGKIKKVDKEACNKCHNATYTVEKYMPNTGKTAENLYVRSHAFPEKRREERPTVGAEGPPNYYAD
jgi:hypothetical protein